MVIFFLFKDNSPRSEDESTSSDLTDSDPCSDSDCTDSDVMLSAQTTIQRLRSASILCDRQFNIEDTRVKNTKSNDSGLGKSSSSSTSSVILPNNTENKHRPLSKQSSMEKLVSISTNDITSQNTTLTKHGSNVVDKQTTSSQSPEIVAQTEPKIVSNNLLRSPSLQNSSKASSKPASKTVGLSMTTTAIVDVSGKVTKPKASPKPGTITSVKPGPLTVKPVENRDSDNDKKKIDYLKVHPITSYI